MNKAIRKIENFLQTDNGQRFLQYAYSFGAAIVIFGAMIKVLHWWGIWGNIIFGTGMAIECLVFILYGLDRPAKNYKWEQVFPVFDSNNPEDRPDFSSGGINQPVISGNVVLGTPSFSSEQQPTQTSSSTQEPMVAPQQTPSSAQPATVFVHHGGVPSAGISSPVPEIEIPQGLSSHAEEYGKQMENLNRNLSGLNTIYEIQLKSISGQIDTIAQINNGLNRLKTMYTDTIPDGAVIKEETDKMAEQLRDLNEIYTRMISAMTNSQPGTRNS
ncbi:MAG: gliding motility protein GldL [Bacteroidia bacterium]|nr:gliding motility protein GldL [Bacteroidia bacterium]